MAKSIRDRYLTDTTFHTVVESMRAIIYGAHLTPSEVREAAVLACILEEERRPISTALVTDQDVIDFAAKQQGDTTRQMLREKGYDV
jgi:hypothetical protein